MMLGAGQLDPPCLERNHTDTEDLIATGVKTSGFQVEGNEFDLTVIRTAGRERSGEIVMQRARRRAAQQLSATVIDR